MAVQNGRKTYRLSSLATKLPAELVEMMLINLSAIDLTAAAANLPRLWRNVIQNSSQIRRIVTSHKWNQAWSQAKRRLASSMDNGILKGAKSSSHFNFSIRTHDAPGYAGTLYIYHTDKAMGLLLVRRGEQDQLIIVDPNFMRSRYDEKAGSATLMLYDLEREFVHCAIVHKSDTDELWRYVLMKCGHEAGDGDSESDSYFELRTSDDMELIGRYSGSWDL